MRPLAKPFCALPLLAATYAFSGATPEPQSFYVHSGDTVVFYGDSITEQRLYTNITELYALTRNPKLNATFINSGWGGDKVTGGGGGPIDLRLQRDVYPYKPTVMTIMLGMNDGRYANHTAADDDVYYSGYRHIIESVRQHFPNIRITAVEPSPFDDVTRPITLQPSGYNEILLKYSSWIRRYAKEANLEVADFNNPVVDMLRLAAGSDSATAQKIIPDRVHPGLAGHLVMAEQLLKAWNAREVVSAVTIDARSGKVLQSDFAHITNLHGNNPFIWTELDDALPLPFANMLANDRDHTVALALKSSDVTQALNEQMLRITGLSAGSYKLTIDGEFVGQWTNNELAHGVNLAVLETPMEMQAAEVRDLTSRHIDIHQFRWRTLQVPLQDSDVEHLDSTLKALDAVEADVVRLQRAAAQPRPHVFQIVPAA
ncbi:MAG: SGNH/GDSL hydrolase family protein [Acidobacteriaceae bacterium]|nr:SGNH/GDSL hydrolase family protein [Acidobacteriaceae bacterium]